MKRVLCALLTIGTTMVTFGIAVAGVTPIDKIPDIPGAVRVPEPTTLLILGAGAGTIIGARAIKKIIKK